MGLPVLLLTSVVSVLGGLVFGYELGVISGALPQLRTRFRLSCVQQEALVSALPAGALLASLCGGRLIDRQGPRRSILVSDALVLAGSLAPLASSYWALLAGRVAVGVAVCVSSMSCCIFVSEAVAPHRRGLMVALYEVGITAGILAAYAANYVLSAAAGGWKVMLALATAPAAAQFVALWLLPSTRGQCSGQGECAPPEGELMNPTANQDEDGTHGLVSASPDEAVRRHVWYLFRSKDNMRRRTTVGLGLVLFQQFTGQPNILFYASTVFRSLGFQSEASAALASVGLGAVKVVATLTSVACADRAGRRPLLMGGCSVMAVCLLALGLLGGGGSAPVAGGACGSEDPGGANASSPSRWGSGNRTWVDEGRGLTGAHTTTHDGVVLACMLAVVSAYAIGFGPMTWVVLSEIFPAEVRGRAFAFTNCFNWSANLLVTFSFLNVIDLIGLSGTFTLYGLTAAAAAVFFHFLLPETKGKSLEEIDKELSANRDHRGEECCGFARRRSSPLKYQRLQCRHVTPE